MKSKPEELRATVWRIEFLHILLAVVLWVLFLPTNLLESGSLIAGALFMGANFLLLTFGIHSVLAPFAGKGRIKTGVALLVLKMALFLGLGSILLFRVRLDPLSFTLGFTCLLLAITFERIWAFTR
jgi:hypothetical protein